jgi:hypothetical protein
MFTSHTTKRHIYHGALVSLLAGLITPWGDLYAAGLATVAAEVRFVSPITVTTSNNLQYGPIPTAIADLETITIATNSAVTDSNNRVSGGIQAARLTVDATATQAMTITANTVTNGTGYTLDSFQCGYSGAVVGACDGDGLSVASSTDSATLLIGATLTGNGLDVGGDANGSFDVTVSYH